jgi:HMG (high mobility group) box
MLGEDWNNMSAQEKAPFIERASEDAVRYKEDAQKFRAAAAAAAAAAKAQAAAQARAQQQARARAVAAALPGTTIVYDL